MEKRRMAAVANDGREGVNAITGQIVTSAIEVHRALGPGLLESVYERCLAYELIQKGLRVETQKDVPIRYKDVQLECGFRMDMLVEGAVVEEIKAVEKVIPVHQAQIMTYLRLAGIQTGLLINFNEVLLKQGIQRFVL